MTSRLVAFGSNAFNNLDPSCDPGPVLQTTDISNVACDRIRWMNFCSTIGQDSQTGRYRIWGHSHLVGDETRICDFVPVKTVKRFLGLDRLFGYLAQDGHVYDLEGVQSAATWHDVVINGLDEVYARSDQGIHILEDFQQLLVHDGTVPATIIHPLISASAQLRLYASDSRVFALLDGQTQHLFEVDQNATLRSVEDFEGLNITVVAGLRNRFGVITDAGDFHIFNTRSKDPELVELPVGADSVRLAGLGSKMDVIVTDSGVFCRGSNERGQLGIEGLKDSKYWIRLQGIEAERIQAVRTNRTGTILEITV